MNEVNELMNDIARRLPDTKEYNQYKNLLDRLKAKPDLYRRVGNSVAEVLGCSWVTRKMRFMQTMNCKMNSVICKIMDW